MTATDQGNGNWLNAGNSWPLRVEVQEWEREWWAGCENTFGEEAKQITYAYRMGLFNEPRDGKWPVYDLRGKSVIDLGGGPVSMLLKCVNRGNSVIVDPLPLPEWVKKRYAESLIGVVRMGAEGFRATQFFDEAWCYNVLQHVIEPQAVIETALHQAHSVRIFEWLETEPCEGHPHTLHAEDLDEWLGGNGTIEFVDENGATGLAYYGVFPSR